MKLHIHTIIKKNNSNNKKFINNVRGKVNFVQVVFTCAFKLYSERRLDYSELCTNIMKSMTMSVLKTVLHFDHFV